MAWTPVQLVAPQQLGTAVSSLYSSPTGVVTRIEKLTVTNPTGGAQTVTIYLVPPAGSPGAGNTISYQKTVNAGQTWNCPDLAGHEMPAGSSLQAVASAATALTIAASGSQFS